MERPSSSSYYAVRKNRDFFFTSVNSFELAHEVIFFDPTIDSPRELILPKKVGFQPKPVVGFIGET